MKRHATTWRTIILSIPMALGVIVVQAGPAHAGGFAVYTHGAKTMGGMTAVAHPAGPDAVFFNPALLPSLESQVEMTAPIVVPDQEFRSDSQGRVTKTQTGALVPGNMFAVKSIGKNKAFGLGIYTPFGLKTSWPRDWEGRYITTESEMRSLEVSGAFAVRCSEKVSVGAGLSAFNAEAELEHMLNFQAFGQPDGSSRFHGKGRAYHFNLGLLYDVDDRTTVAFSYQNGMRLHLQGQADFEVPATMPPYVSMAFPDTNGEASLDLPYRYWISCARKLGKGTVLEATIQVEGWRDYDALVFKFDTPVGGAPGMIVDKRWRNAIAYMIGVESPFGERHRCRMGVLFEQGPVPDDTFEPSIPSSDKVDLSLGATLAVHRVELTPFYVYEYYLPREKRNDIGIDALAPANGRYTGTAQVLGLSLALKM